jgi:hypothetical protein
MQGKIQIKMCVAMTQESTKKGTFIIPRNKKHFV